MAGVSTVDGGLRGPGSRPRAVVLGIDPSLTGFAVTAMSLNDDDFESWVYKSPQRGVDRLIDIVQWLTSVHTSLTDVGHTVFDVAMEDGVFHSISASVLGELSAAVRMWAWSNMLLPGKYPLKVPPTMVKKYATDRGNAKKNEVMLAVYKHWGVEFTDDNMADSYVIARIVRGSGDTQYRRDVLGKLMDPKFRDAL